MKYLFHRFRLLLAFLRDMVHPFCFMLYDTVVQSCGTMSRITLV